MMDASVWTDVTMSNFDQTIAALTAAAGEPVIAELRPGSSAVVVSPFARFECTRGTFSPGVLELRIRTQGLGYSSHHVYVGQDRLQYRIVDDCIYLRWIEKARKLAFYLTLRAVYPCDLLGDGEEAPTRLSADSVEAVAARMSLVLGSDLFTVVETDRSLRQRVWQACLALPEASGGKLLTEGSFWMSTARGVTHLYVVTWRPGVGQEVLEHRVQQPAAVAVSPRSVSLVASSAQTSWPVATTYFG